MSDGGYDFKKELKNSIFNADPKIDRNELLIDIFKSYVAKLFEITLKKGRLPYEAMAAVKQNLICEFVGAELAEYQKGEQWYSDLFDECVKEILNIAAMRHKGQDSAVRADNELVINPDVYINEGGMYKPVSSL